MKIYQLNKTVEIIRMHKGSKYSASFYMLFDKKMLRELRGFPHLKQKSVY